MNYQTEGGVELTPEQCKLIDSFKRLMKKWDSEIAIRGIAGKLTLMLLGDSDQNPLPEFSDTGGFNQDNIIIDHFPNVSSDGGDW